MTAVAAMVASSSGAYPQDTVPVIGYLSSESPERFATRLGAFHDGLRETGFEERRNLRVEYRWAEGHNEALPSLAADLVARNVAVLVAPGSIASALAAKAATKTIPIVFETGTDPVNAGLVPSLQRPGGNITGVSSLNAEVGPKRLELLHSVLPAAKRFALLVNPRNPKNAESVTRDLRAAAARRGLEIHLLEAGTEEEVEAAFGTAARVRAAGLVIANDIFYATRTGQIAGLATRHALPAIHQSPEFATAGGLMSYGGDVRQSHREAGVYTGRILKGEKPADLPIQQVTRIYMAINLKSAAALGLTIPPTLLALADEVIE
ncbi:MAG TPA: ABC transporter substrate-binding protein [Beijerinckiaceae bacterium]